MQIEWNPTRTRISVGVKERNNFKVNTIEIQNLLSLSRSGIIGMHVAKGKRNVTE